MMIIVKQFGCHPECASLPVQCTMALGSSDMGAFDIGIFQCA